MKTQKTGTAVSVQPEAPTGQVRGMFSTVALMAIGEAEKKAREMGHAEVGLTHLLWAALRWEDAALQQEGDVVPMLTGPGTWFPRLFAQERGGSPTVWGRQGKLALARALKGSNGRVVPLGHIVKMCLLERSHPAVREVFSRTVDLLEEIRKTLSS